MTADQKQKYPWPLYILSAFLVLLALRDYFSKYALYSRFREAGIPAGEMWNFSTYPREASLYLFQHILGFAAIGALLALWLRNKHFPTVFLAYYVAYVTISVATAVLYPGTHMFGAILVQSVLCLPWLLYVFKSRSVQLALGGYASAPAPR